MLKRIIKIQLFIIVIMLSQVVFGQHKDIIIEKKDGTKVRCFVNAIEKITFEDIPTTVTDIDGNVYATIVIGDQVWMAENLKVTKYRNGLSITDVWPVDGSEANVDTYGRLYSWYEVNKHVTEDDPDYNIAPEGWHVPTDAEWTELKNYLNNNGHPGTEGTVLKSTSGWYNNGNGTDNYGFTGLPAGYRNFSGSFDYMGTNATFWSASEYDTSYAWYRSLGYNNSGIYRTYYYEKYGFSVRCVRD